MRRLTVSRNWKKKPLALTILISSMMLEADAYTILNAIWHSQIYRQIVGQTNRDGERRTDRQTERESDRQSDRQTDRQTSRQAGRQADRNRVCLLVGWLLNVPATCWCISGTDLPRQFYVLPHLWTEAADQTFYLDQAGFETRISSLKPGALTSRTTLPM